MHGSYLLNTNSQNIVQCAAAQRAVTTADVLKMTQADDGNLPVFAKLCAARTANPRVQRNGGCIGLELPMRSTSAVTTALILLLGIGVAEAANPTLLAETGGFLLGNAHRCGVAVERVERAGNVIHDFIVAAARDSSEAAAADSRFAEIFLASDLPDQDPDAFPSCTVVIEQFDRLERHHEQVGRNRGTRAASSGL
jgi:hypothetical protein